MPDASAPLHNRFLHGLREGRVQYGLWLSLADPVAAEIAAGAGFDWVLIDGEHAPNDLRTTLHQLQAVGGYPVSPIVRPVSGTPEAIKQLLDLGAPTLLVPMVESAEQAVALVHATRYPPRGGRGVATARASRWGRTPGYWADADDETGLVVQVESLAGVAAIDAIAAVDGVDAVFVGPSDLGAAMGHLGAAGHPDVVAAVVAALGAIVRAGKPAGVLTTDATLAATYRDAGATFIGLGVDTLLLARATSALLASVRGS